MSRNDNYVTGNLLDYLHDQKHYKLIGIDLPRKKNVSIPQQINFEGKFKKDDVATMFAENQQETILNFSVDSSNVR